MRGAMMGELEAALVRVGREDLVSSARFAMERSVAASTLKVYTSVERARRRLAEACGLEGEADLSLCLYVLDAMAKKRSRSTVAMALAAFGFARGEDPRVSHFGPLLGAAAKSAGRTVPSEAHAKATREQVNAIIKWGIREGASPADLRVSVLSLFSFAALLRVSEAVALTRTDVQLRRGDEESELVLGVTIKSAKNDQEGKGRTTFLSLKAGSIGRVAWDRYKAFLSSRISSFLFPSLNAADEGMKTDFVRKELARACEGAGIDRLSPHSFRGGGATTSIEEGTPMALVQKRGRWKSDQGVSPYIADSVRTQGGTLSL